MDEEEQKLYFKEERILKELIKMLTKEQKLQMVEYLKTIVVSSP